MYYVYHHIRNDTGLPFYVGKGKNDRASSKKNRNKHWHHIVESAGYHYEIVCAGLDEELAFLCESELIDQYRRLGYVLANYTNGGEGPSGYKHTEESKEKMRGPRRGGFTRVFTDEHRARISAAKKNKPSSTKGRVLSQEHKDKISKANKGLMSSYFWWNDGTKSTRSETCPGDGWVKGRVKRGK